jgi:hypothetical protein
VIISITLAKHKTTAMKLFNSLVLGLTYTATATAASSAWKVVPANIVTWGTFGPNKMATLMLDWRFSPSVTYARTQLFEFDCSTPTNAMSYFFETRKPALNSQDSVYQVHCALYQTTLTSSSLWSSTLNNTIGQIKFCARVDLLDNTNTSYNFNEQKVTVNVDLTQPFSLANVTVGRDAANVDSAAAATNFGITACQCGQTNACSPSTLVQGDPVRICIQSTVSGVKISSVKALQYTKTGSPVLEAVADSTAVGLTTVSNPTGAVAAVQTQLPSDLFTNSGVLNATGTVVVSFGSGRARNLRFAIGSPVDNIGGSVSRMTQEQTNDTDAGFSISIALAPNKSEEVPKANSNMLAIVGGIIGGIAGVAVMVALVLAARRKSKDTKDDDTKDIKEDIKDDDTEDNKDDDKEVNKEVNKDVFKDVFKEEDCMTHSDFLA